MRNETCSYRGGGVWLTDGGPMTGPDQCFPSGNGRSWTSSGRTWNATKATALLDEHPAAYKDIDQVMADQADLVEVQHTLRQVLNYKGT